MLLYCTALLGGKLLLGTWNFFSLGVVSRARLFDVEGGVRNLTLKRAKLKGISSSTSFIF